MDLRRGETNTGYNRVALLAHLPSRRAPKPVETEQLTACTDGARVRVVSRLREVDGGPCHAVGGVRHTHRRSSPFPGMPLRSLRNGLNTTRSGQQGDEPFGRLRVRQPETLLLAAVDGGAPHEPPRPIP